MVSMEGTSFTYSGSPLPIARSSSMRFAQQPETQQRSRSGRRLVTFATEGGGKSRGERRQTVSLFPDSAAFFRPTPAPGPEEEERITRMERNSLQRASYHRATRQGPLRPLNELPPVMSQSLHQPSSSDRRGSQRGGVHFHYEPHRRESSELAAQPRIPQVGEVYSSSGSDSGGGSPVSSSAASDQGYRSQESPPQSSTGARASTKAKGRRQSSSLKGILRSSKSENNLKHQQMGNSSDLSREEIYQIRLMFSGKGTSVVVSQCLANLYFAAKRSNGRVSWAEEDRELKATGVPVLVMDKGSSRARSFRRLHIILAEKGTGFLLWRDTIDSLSKYAEVGKSFHTMFLSTNHQRQAGLSFDTPYAAMSFFSAVMEATSDPDNVALSQENLRKAQTGAGRGGRTAKLRKSEISQPCAFAHITSLKPNDLDVDVRPKRAQSCLTIGSPLRSSSSYLLQSSTINSHLSPSSDALS